MGMCLRKDQSIAFLMFDFMELGLGGEKLEHEFESCSRRRLGKEGCTWLLCKLHLDLIPTSTCIVV